jgi:hypothetical protein
MSRSPDADHTRTTTVFPSQKGGGVRETQDTDFFCLSGPTAPGERDGSRSGGPHPTVTGAPTSRRGGNPTCGPDRGVGNQRPFSRPVVSDHDGKKKGPAKLLKEEGCHVFVVAQRHDRALDGDLSDAGDQAVVCRTRGALHLAERHGQVSARPPRLVSTSRACRLYRPTSSILQYQLPSLREDKSGRVRRGGGGLMVMVSEMPRRWRMGWGTGRKGRSSPVPRPRPQHHT